MPSVKSLWNDRASNEIRGLLSVAPIYSKAFESYVLREILRPRPSSPARTSLIIGKCLSNLWCNRSINDLILGIASLPLERCIWIRTWLSPKSFDSDSFDLEVLPESESGFHVPFLVLVP